MTQILAHIDIETSLQNCLHFYPNVTTTKCKYSVSIFSGAIIIFLSVAVDNKTNHYTRSLLDQFVITSSTKREDSVQALSSTDTRTIYRLWVFMGLCIHAGYRSLIMPLEERKWLFLKRNIARVLGKSHRLMRKWKAISSLFISDYRATLNVCLLMQGYTQP